MCRARTMRSTVARRRLGRPSSSPHRNKLYESPFKFCVVRYLIADKGNNGLHGSPEESVTEGKRPRKPKSASKQPLHVDERLKEHMQTLARRTNWQMHGAARRRTAS